MNRLLLGILLLFTSNRLIAQAAVSCPPNIGFELGTFDYWDCYEGTILTDGTLSLLPSPPIGNVHTIIERGPTPVMDPYGNFPVNCPNGSKYSIQLGNKETRQGAERVSYTFQIPATQDQFSIIYNYAVVIENPPHQPYQQPKFTSKVFDVTAGSYISCASFEFIASPSLPGFLPAPSFPNVYYKPWAAVTIDLNGFAGKTVRLEFTNNDCTLGGHFGYAYLDVNENCNSPIKGNVACGNSNSITLRAPFGFQEYKWYDATVTNLLGTSSNLVLTPVPAPGTVYAVILVPYPGLGCLDTIFTDISKVADIISLNFPDTIRGCANPGVDLTQPSLSAGSSSNLYLSYYADESLTQFIPYANMITQSGHYYVNAVNMLGCNVTKKVYVELTPAPTINFSSPLWGCYPDPVNITDPMIYTGTDAGLSLTYWTNAAATTSVTNPTSVPAGNYFIKGVNSNGCYTIKTLTVDLAQLKTWPISTCVSADLTSPARTAGSSFGFDYTYWKDSAATVPVTDPKAVTESGRYFIKGEHIAACVQVKGLDVSIVSANSYTVTDPPEVKYPGNIDLSTTISSSGNITFSYWSDTMATKKLANWDRITESGTYYIKGITHEGCAIIKPVHVKIKLPDPPKIEAPNAFSPNGDGVNDVFKINLEGPLRKIEFRVYNRYGTLIYHTNKPQVEWNGKTGDTDVPTGTYYWTLEAEDSFRKEKIQLNGSVTLIR